MSSSARNFCRIYRNQLGWFLVLILRLLADLVLVGKGLVVAKVKLLECMEKNEFRFVL